MSAGSPGAPGEPLTGWAVTNEALARAESVEDWEVEAGYEAERSVDEPEGVERERFVGISLCGTNRSRSAHWSRPAATRRFTT